MATARDLFDTEQPDLAGPEGPLPLETNGRPLQPPVMWRNLLSFHWRSQILALYVPEIAGVDPFSLCHVALKAGSQWVLERMNGISIFSGHVREDRSLFQPLDDCVFTGRVLLYVEAEFSDNQRRELLDLGRELDLAVDVRDLTYVRRIDRRRTPDAFIAHDSRDKETVARPLAQKLNQGLCKVWYDEYSLQVGDSLRAKIEEGIKKCRRCILILTPHFLSNTGWSRREFDSVFTRELIEQTAVILPVWANVSARDVYDYSPSLADRVGLDWSLGDEEVARRLLKAIA